MKILAIESSCDETAASVIDEQNRKPVILSNIVSSQIDLHKTFGGVVPEVAARAHIENIIPVINEALEKAKTDLEEIDYLAFTNGPGLIGSLIVGVETAKGMAAANGIPLLPINHLEGHIYAAFADNDRKPAFPVLTLLVSGGNTLLILMKDHLHYEVVGKTIDDAAGEAFDKAAKVMGLGYPGGPIISKLSKEGDPSKYPLPIIDLTPRPHRDREGYLIKPEPSLDFSFSGLKTALITQVRSKGKLSQKERRDLSASFEKAVVETLVQNSINAITKYRPKTFVLAGGVAANPELRARLGEEIGKVSPKLSYLIPETSLCGDNAAMIGLAGYYRIRNSKQPTGRSKTRDSRAVVAEPNLKIV